MSIHTSAIEAAYIPSRSCVLYTNIHGRASRGHLECKGQPCSIRSRWVMATAAQSHKAVANKCYWGYIFRTNLMILSEFGKRIKHCRQCTNTRTYSPQQTQRNRIQYKTLGTKCHSLFSSTCDDDSFASQDQISSYYSRCDWMTVYVTKSTDIFRM